MQTLSQPQANQLRDVLEYARLRLHHPEQGPIQLIGTHAPIQPTPQQIRQQADERASRIEAWQQWVSDVDELLALIKTLDYARALDGATIENTAGYKEVPLVDLLTTPDKYDGLGKRDEVPWLPTDKEAGL